jgi:hypothetical protein
MILWITSLIGFTFFNYLRHYLNVSNQKLHECLHLMYQKLSPPLSQPWLIGVVKLIKKILLHLEIVF